MKQLLRSHRGFHVRAATRSLMDLLLAKKRAGDRKSWLETKGNLAEVLL